MLVPIGTGFTLLYSCSCTQGAQVIADMMRNSPPEVFEALVTRGNVGLFTWTDKTTIFPEYEHLRDRPECEGIASP